MGDRQERRLFDRLEHSPSRWNVITPQTIMAQVDDDAGAGLSVNHDQRDGYRVSRERLLRFLRRGGTANPIVLSGDWHSAWVNDLRLVFDRPETPVIATEFVGTSISSGCGWADAVEALGGRSTGGRRRPGDRRLRRRIRGAPVVGEPYVLVHQPVRGAVDRRRGGGGP